ncbi:MAG TPA: ABC transporter permease [Bryobacteraceae bacterium]|jgi:predicted permease|nr:ABC transporter permease [Bryobacteraceae bacterium]
MFLSRWWNVLRARLRTLLKRPSVETELEKELRFHLERQREENVARGMSADEARYAASRRLGGITQIQEECRDMRRTGQLESILSDVQFAARTLIHTPGFSAAIIVTMAIAIGANSAIFSVIDGVLLKPLPYPQPERLVRVFLNNPEYPKFPLNPFDLKDYRERSRSFESLTDSVNGGSLNAIGGYARDDLQLSGIDTPMRLTAFAVTAGFFHVLGERPAIGREFSTRDELAANGHVVILSHELWNSRFASQPNILGRKIILNGEPYTVVGVMRSGFAHPGNDYHAVAYGQRVDVWVPFPFRDNPANRGSHFVDGIGRLKTGVTVAQAQADLNAVMAQMAREHEGDRGWHVRLTPLQSEIVGGTQRLLWTLLGAVGLVLLIACVNAANLLLARATIRSREFALRAALGARRSRLIRLLLTESILLSLIGAALGGAIALAGVNALVALLPSDFPRAGDIHVNAAMFLFTLTVAIATGILFGLAPAWQGSNVDLRTSLHQSGRSVTSSAGVLRLRNSLVVSEIALACLLLIGAGLMLRSFANLLDTNPGFRPTGTVTASISLRSPSYDYAKPESINRFYEQLLLRLVSTPGVSAAGIATDLPWTGYDDNTGFTIQDKTPPPNTEFHARYHSASPDYFRVLGIPLLKGRFFNAHDRKESSHSLIINQAMAQRYWPGEDALGRRITFEDHPKESDWLPIVGIVGDVKDTPASDGAEPAFWWSLPEWPYMDVSVAVRGRSEPSVLADDIRAAVHALDPSLAIAEVRTMDEIAAKAYSSSQFALLLFGLFALLALVLAGIGTYAVMSYSMNQRSHEFGLRMALGAQSRDVFTYVFRQGMKLTIGGTAIGVVSSLILGRFLASLLYRVSAHDTLTMAAACFVVIATAALACYVPARRATQNDPMNALRAD